MNLRNLAITGVIILALLAGYAALSQGGAMNGMAGQPAQASDRRHVARRRVGSGRSERSGREGSAEVVETQAGPGHRGGADEGPTAGPADKQV